MAVENDAVLGLLGISFLMSLTAFVGARFLGPLAPAVLVMAVLAAPAAFIAQKWGYWVVPYFTRGQKMIYSHDAEVDIPLSDDAILKQVGDSYYATMFIAIRIYKSSTTMSEQEKFSFMDLWERAISGLKTVTKYSVLVYIKDLAKYKESIEARKAQAQMEMAKESDRTEVDKAHAAALEREIAMWDNVVSKVSGGDKPLAVLTYVQVSAKGPTKDIAMATVRQALSEIRSTVGTALNVELGALSGDDLRRCYDWEYALPSSLKEL